MKALPHQKEVDLLESGPYLSELVNYIANNPSTLMVQMMALVRFRYKGLFTSSNHWVLVMDNFKRGLDWKTSSFAEFDMKGSKWKHRIQGKGGMRCDPLFPASFWRSGAGKPHTFTGEDLDFYALRTQTNRQWLEDRRAGGSSTWHRATAATPGSARRKALDRQIEALPVYDECMGGAHARKWLSNKAKPGLDFCGELGNLSRVLSEELAERPGSQYSAADIKALEDAWSVAQRSCKDFVRSGTTSAQWKHFLHEEKASIDAVRDFFGYAAPSLQITQRPLVMEPCIRARLVAQLARDTAFLSKHGVMDYSMGLIIHHQGEVGESLDGAEPGRLREAQTPGKHVGAADTCGRATAALSGGGQYDTTKSNSVFEKYKGGISAVGAHGGEAPEQAVFTFKIVDTLTKWGVGKAISQWAQSIVADDKAEAHLLPVVWQELASSMGSNGVGKCKDLTKRSVKEGDGQVCWSGCAWNPSCAGFDSRLTDKKSSQWVGIAKWNFQGDWVKDDPHTNDLNCNGWTNGADEGRRALCAVSAASTGELRELTGLPAAAQLSTMPEPFRSVMDDDAVRRALALEVPDELLKDFLQLKTTEVLPNNKGWREWVAQWRKVAPPVLKRLAVMAYYDFARRPQGEDTVPPDEYAERFRRFVSAWTAAPQPEAWREMCPEAAKAGCRGVLADFALKG